VSNSVLFITPGPISWASSRMRAYWIAEKMPYARVAPKPTMEQLTSADVVIFVKRIDIDLVKQIHRNGKRVYWDICDPTHWYNPKESREMVDEVDGIIASNAGLKHEFERWSVKSVHMIPDCIKLEHYKKQREHVLVRPTRFIWYGAGQNRFSLYGAMPALERLACNGVEISLTIYDDRPDEYERVTNTFPIYHGGWKLEQENAVIAAHDVAILPPYPGMWGKVKSDNKRLTAYACGLPFTDGENYEWLFELATCATARSEAAIEGMEYLKAHHLIENAVEMWSKILWP